MDSEPRFAILIDADNISDRYVKIILDEAANSGIATYKRIYGDWTSPRLASWKNVLLENSIIPMQQYSYTIGKNATDSSIIIDAMDILYSGNVDGFCLVSSDSDFTRLASRLRESGMQVIGMGEQKTPKPFISACNQFKYLDLIYSNQQKEEKEEKEEKEPETAETPKQKAGAAFAKQKTAVSAAKQKEASSSRKKSTSSKEKELKQVRKTINAIIEKFSDEDGWLFSGKLGDQLSRRMPEFDVRNYGFTKFTPFIMSLGNYETDKRPASGGSTQIYFRMK
ncbi:MAG: NYN domain-containing protein [Lachnospiraceae bacterium]|nr:NYN domain-containing protein [Lachnospiraceae bacterium]